MTYLAGMEAFGRSGLAMNKRREELRSWSSTMLWMYVCFHSLSIPDGMHSIRARRDANSPRRIRQTVCYA